MCGALLFLDCSDYSRSAHVVSAPKDDGFLKVTQGWERRSQLGDLLTRPMGADDVELRVWVGYGDGPPPSGLILRRTLGKWAAWDAQVTRVAVRESDDTLIVEQVARNADLEKAWRDAVRAGVLALPPKRWRGAMDGGDYVIEVRRGNEYRASVIEVVDPPEVDADRQVKAIYKIVMTGLLFPDYY
jgi:hypothetical protein